MKKLISALEKIKRGSTQLSSASATAKNQALLYAASLLEEKMPLILKSNALDVKAAKAKKISTAFIDRLTLNSERIQHMATSLRAVAKLPDPVGEVVETRTLENGLLVKRVRAPLGVIFIIFESRPNVAIEAFSLAFKSGNGAILRGGKESQRTVGVLYDLLFTALKKFNLEKSLWGITDSDRKIPQFLLKQTNYIDVVVPRGGEGLIQFVVKGTTIPIIKNDRGLCHAYVHEDANLEMAENIVCNAKVSRPSACNSIETVLVHKRIAPEFLPRLFKKMTPFNVTWHCDPASLGILKGGSRLFTPRRVKKVVSKNWATEYLDFEINCRVVDGLDSALEHIAEFGSRHSESIVTQSETTARKFQSAIDAAAVYWNASTRFTDGFELGLGGEIGISTQKLHVRGPVGLRELTSLRWIIDGAGQVR